METTVIEITDWHHFSKEVKDLGYKSWIFRGQSDVEWKLECSLWRALNELPVEESSYFVREKDVLQTFKSSAHHYLNQLPTDDETLEWWSLMQHYGAPTRLLDWTYSPYTAAFFALEKAVQRDSCVYGLYIANIQKHNKKNGITELSYNYLAKGEHSPFVGLFNSRLRNQRLISQQGIFTVQSVIDRTLDEILQEYPDQPEKDKGKGLVKFVFNGSVENFSDYVSFLHRMNISNASLFPSIEGLSRSLRLDLMNIASKF